LPVETVKERLTIEGRKRFMSIAEKIRNEGMEQGKKEGQRENRIKVAKKALLLNLDVKQIKKEMQL